MVGRGASLEGRLFLGGTDGSNPVCSSGESHQPEHSGRSLDLTGSNLHWRAPDRERASPDKRRRLKCCRGWCPSRGSRRRQLLTWRDRGRSNHGFFGSDRQFPLRRVRRGAQSNENDACSGRRQTMPAASSKKNPLQTLSRFTARLFAPRGAAGPRRRPYRLVGSHTANRRAARANRGLSFVNYEYFETIPCANSCTRGHRKRATRIFPRRGVRRHKRRGSPR